MVFHPGANSVSLRRAALVLLTCSALAACGSGGDDDAGSSVAGPGADGVDVEFDTATADVADLADVADVGDAGGQPSGAQVRIVNVYAPLNGEPGAVDIYADPFVLDDATPIGSVGYGTASDFFDPTVADDAGNMFLSFYAAGTTGNGAELMSQTETLAGGEVITYLLATGENVQESGARYGSLRPFFHVGEFTTPPTAGTGALLVDTLGLDQIVANPDETYYYVGVGNGCAPAVGDDEFTKSLLGTGTSVNYELAPGSYQASIYSTEGCTGTPLVGDVPIEITEGGQSFLIVYAPADGDLRALFVPAP